MTSSPSSYHLWPLSVNRRRLLKCFTLLDQEQQTVKTLCHIQAHIKKHRTIIIATIIFLYDVCVQYPMDYTLHNILYWCLYDNSVYSTSYWTDELDRFKPHRSRTNLKWIQVTPNCRCQSTTLHLIVCLDPRMSHSSNGDTKKQQQTTHPPPPPCPRLSYPTN